QAGAGRIGSRRRPRTVRRHTARRGRSGKDRFARRPAARGAQAASLMYLSVLPEHTMRTLLIPPVVAATVAAAASTMTAQDLSFGEMRWRDIGPTRAGRARALAGVPSEPNTFYAGFDNGGVWRSTDYGANWVPLFDDQSTGSIGAIAVAPSNPSVIYVGSGAGTIRPDLAIGDRLDDSNDR